MPVITGKSIIHVTTEFASARAGGLGIVVNDIAKEQAIAGNTVSILVPFFIHKDSLAYDFIYNSNVDFPKKHSIEADSEEMNYLMTKYLA